MDELRLSQIHHHFEPYKGILTDTSIQGYPWEKDFLHLRGTRLAQNHAILPFSYCSRFPSSDGWDIMTSWKINLSESKQHFRFCWESHLPKPHVVWDSLRRFTVNPKICTLRLEGAKYLWCIVALRGLIKPLFSKENGRQTWSCPLSKKQVHAFLDIVG